MSGTPEPRETVAVAGASGYVGAALGPVLGPRFRLVGVARSPRTPELGYVEWRQTNLLSLSETEAALEDVDRAVYLVHSMLPADRLAQGSFEDFDLICADNFGRAARRAGVRQIVYLGGLVPPGDERHLSRHLTSRRETEAALGAAGVPVTTIRAGLVIGPEGSSFVMLERLVRRLPMMVCPGWTQTLTQPVALDDVVHAIAGVLGHPETLGRTFDVGCPEVLSYQAMMERTARALGLRRPMVNVPYFSIGLSRLWVSVVTGAPRELVAPLIQSLVHPMVARDHELFRLLGIVPTPLDTALERALSGPRSVRRRPRRKRPVASTVLSVQRMPLPEGRDAAWVAHEYLLWLPRVFRSLIRVETKERGVTFRLWPLALPLLELTYLTDGTSSDRQLLCVAGGWLARKGARLGRLEFREVSRGREVLAAVYDFEPRLPWLIYAWTQAPLHGLVMHAFGRHLARLATPTAA